VFTLARPLADPPTSCAPLDSLCSLFTAAFPLKVYDYLVSIGVSPLVELSWMPAAIASKPTEKVWCYKGGHSKPKSVDDWHTVIAALAKHLVARYGADTVRKWSFEVWNEPNCPPCISSTDSLPPDELFPQCVPGVSVRNADYPACTKAGGGWTLEVYLAVFNATSAALKSADAHIPVGGPSTEQLGWIDELRNYCGENDVGLDFISTHQYPSDTQVRSGHS
jgi:xylan 1,4-beta-xylosidase